MSRVDADLPAVSDIGPAIGDAIRSEVNGEGVDFLVGWRCGA
jgi:hypothetical protein